MCEMVLLTNGTFAYIIDEMINETQRIKLKDKNGAPGHANAS